ncbi:MAG: hypothetical protein ABR543_03210 [Gemmatimonadaceae bacterium]
MKRCASLRVASVLVLTGCAYYNGLYNSRAAEKKADKLARSGRIGEAESYYTVAAVKAETVLVRYKKSRWADDALYLAGRGWALSGQCDRATPRLDSYLGLSGQPADRLNRATLALGICHVKQHQYIRARSILAPLLSAKERGVSHDAALWAARASIAMGENDSALVFLRRIGASAAEWELANAYLERAQYAPAESLLVLRGRAGDFRPEVIATLSALWTAGRRDGVESIVSAYDSSRLSTVQRARLHFVLGDLWMNAGGDSLARVHLSATQRLVRDSLMGREAAARIGLLSLGKLTTLVDVESAIRSARETADGTSLLQRMSDNLLLIKILEDRTDFTGSSLFLAAEVARDSLRAYALAHNYLVRSVASAPRSPVAAKALLAAAALEPDSAESYFSRLRTEYPTSSYTAVVTSGDSLSTGKLSLADDLLRQVWELSVRQYADSLRILRPPPDGTPGNPVAASGMPGQPTRAPAEARRPPE